MYSAETETGLKTMPVSLNTMNLWELKLYR